MIYDACLTPYAVVPDQVETHLTAHHCHVPRYTHRRIVQELNNLARNREDVIYPELNDEPVEGLPVEGLPLYKNAIRCLGT